MEWLSLEWLGLEWLGLEPGLDWSVLDWSGLDWRGYSLRIKLFRGVGKQRKSEKRDFRRFALAKNGARTKKRKKTPKISCRQLPLAHVFF